jgi:hypothetical protein
MVAPSKIRKGLDDTLPTVKTNMCVHADYKGECNEEDCPLREQIIYEKFVTDCFYKNTVLDIQLVQCLEYKTDSGISYIPFNAEAKKADFSRKTTEKTDDINVIGRLRKVDGKYKVKIYRYCGACIHLGHIADSLKNLAKFRNHTNRCLWHNVGRNKDSSACRDIREEKYPGEKEYHERKKRNEEANEVRRQVEKT